MTEPLHDPLAEGRRIAHDAARRGAPVRLTGGVAIALRCPSAAKPALRREYADIDVVVRGRASGSVEAFFRELGYAPDQEFNALHGARRQLFWSTDGSRQIDIFVDRYEMCHRLELRDRFDVHEQTLPLADLLLTKLQVVETNEKDFVDIATLLTDHALTQDETGINLTYISRLASSDWGWWRTITMIAARAAVFAEQRNLSVGEYNVVGQVHDLLAALESSPKSRRWKLRARVGDRVLWYEPPEEAG